MQAVPGAFHSAVPNLQSSEFVRKAALRQTCRVRVFLGNTLLGKCGFRVNEGIYAIYIYYLHSPLRPIYTCHTWSVWVNLRLVVSLIRNWMLEVSHISDIVCFLPNKSYGRGPPKISMRSLFNGEGSHALKPQASCCVCLCLCPSWSMCSLRASVVKLEALLWLQ